MGAKVYSSSTVYSNIVVGTDGSEPAWRAVTHAVGLAKATGAALHVVQGVPRPMHEAGLAGVPVTPPSMQESVDTFKAFLDAQVEPLDHEPLSVEVREGNAADVLMDVADEVDADVIVVGSRGMSGAKRFVLGSVPNAVSHHARCAVLIVKTD